jgi:hypothetical protein
MPNCLICFDFDPIHAWSGPSDVRRLSQLVDSCLNGCDTCKILKEFIEGLIDIQDPLQYFFGTKLHDEPCYLDLKVWKRGEAATEVDLFRQGMTIFLLCLIQARVRLNVIR